MQMMPIKYCILTMDDNQEFLDHLIIILSGNYMICSTLDSKEGLLFPQTIVLNCFLLDLNIPKYFGRESSVGELAFLEHLWQETSSVTMQYISTMMITDMVRKYLSIRMRVLSVHTILRKLPDFSIFTQKIIDVRKGNNRLKPIKRGREYDKKSHRVITLSI